MQRNVAVAWISAEVIRVLEAEANRSGPCETGGVLLGYWVVAPPVVVVTKAVGPGPRAQHEPNLFVPDHGFHEQQVALAYRDSNAVTTYLGDWHTHPAGRCRLSHLDKTTLRAIARSPAARMPTPLMAVLAGGSPWNFALWVARRSWGRLRFRQLRFLEY